jgi:hypothetical protein
MNHHSQIQWEINNKVDVFITTFIGTKSIISLRDLDVEISLLLQSFCYPEYNIKHNINLTSSQSSSSFEKDPNEIDLDIDEIGDDCNNNNNINNRLKTLYDYGLPPICQHPRVMQMFSLHHFHNDSNCFRGNSCSGLQCYSSCCMCYNNSSILSSSDICNYLIEFLRSKDDLKIETINQHNYSVDCIQQTELPLPFNIVQFEQYLCESIEINLLGDVGIVIKGDLKLELLMAQHVLTARKKVIIDIQKNELENINKDWFNYNEEVKLKKNNNSLTQYQENSHDNLEMLLKKSDVKFKPSSHEDVNIFVDSCSKLLCKDSSSCSSSSFTKVLKVVQKKLETLSSTYSSNEEKLKIKLQLVEVVAEYVTLRIGSSKFRKNRLELSLSSSISASINNELTNYVNTKNYDNNDKFANSTSNDSSTPNISSSEAITILSNKGKKRILEDDNNDIILDAKNLNNAAVIERKLSMFNSKGVFNSNKSLSNKNFNSKNIRIIDSQDLSSMLPYCGDNFCTSDLKQVGKWGESLVFQYLTMTYRKSEVIWLNKDVESNASYDLTLNTPNNINNKLSSTAYIEVKTTRFADNNVFELSYWEWQFATATPKVDYHIYRVYNAGIPNKVYIVVITDILNMITEGNVKLCLAL